MRTPILIVNFKNYPEIFGKNSVVLARRCGSVAKEIGAEIAVAPPTPLLASVVAAVTIPVLSQHLDTSSAGSTTGAIIPEVAKSAGAIGSILNHSERRIPASEIQVLVERLKELGMVSVVCAKTPEEVSKLASLSPDFLAIEPPELIGTGRAVSKVRPEVVSLSVRASAMVNPAVKVICGAGIVEGVDVERALSLGAQGVLVSSSIVKAGDWYSKIKELASPLRSSSAKN